MLKQSHWCLHSQHKIVCCSLSQILPGSSFQHKQGVLLETLSGHAGVLYKQLQGGSSWTVYNRCFTAGRFCTQQTANILLYCTR